MKDIIISDDIIYIGADDKDIELFENQYNVPNGVAYNSYIIIDKKIAIMDTIDKRRTNQWLENLDKALNGRRPDYLVISHLEPDHAYNINTLMKKYPDIKLVGNSKTFTFLPQFFDIQNLDSKKIEVKEGEILDLGNHKLKFIMAPMVHWPEVMMTYEEKEKILRTNKNVIIDNNNENLKKYLPKLEKYKDYSIFTKKESMLERWKKIF